MPAAHLPQRDLPVERPLLGSASAVSSHSRPLGSPTMSFQAPSGCRRRISELVADRPRERDLREAALAVVRRGLRRDHVQRDSPSRGQGPSRCSSLLFLLRNDTRRDRPLRRSHAPRCSFRFPALLQTRQLRRRVCGISCLRSSVGDGDVLGHVKRADLDLRSTRVPSVGTRRDQGQDGPSPRSNGHVPFWA
jgi:hypothetical protein